MSLLALPERVTMAEAGPLALALVGQMSAAAREEAVNLDASALRTFDTSALALMLDLLRAAAREGRQLRVVHLPERARALARLYGVESLIDPAAPPPH